MRRAQCANDLKQTIIALHHDASTSNVALPNNGYTGGDPNDLFTVDAPAPLQGADQPRSRAQLRHPDGPPGHDRPPGGPFALHVFFTKPQPFPMYPAASPSIWRNDGFLAEERGFTEKYAGREVDSRLLTSVGGVGTKAPVGGRPRRWNAVGWLIPQYGEDRAAVRDFAEKGHGAVVLSDARRGSGSPLMTNQGDARPPTTGRR